MDDVGGVDRSDLATSESIAVEAGRRWGLDLGPSFALSTHSFVAPAGDAVLKVAWDGDDESLHEPDALELWDGNGAVRLLRRSGRSPDPRRSPAEPVRPLRLLGV